MIRQARYTILLVDDDPMILSGLRRGLHDEPFRVLTAQSGSEGLEIAQRQPIDAVISDQDMPGLDGISFLKRVREVHPLSVRFMLTGKPSLDVAMDAVNLGEITRFLTKPCDVQDLAVSLRQALAHKDLLEEARKLLAKAQEQERLISNLGIAERGLLDVRRDEEGAILLEDLPTDVGDLCDAIESLLGEGHE